VTFSSAGVESPGPILTAKALDLRVEVADQTARYSYSLDGGKTFVALGAPAPLRFSWWKGARPALFTYGDPAPSKKDGTKQGVADFDWVTVKPVPRDRQPSPPPRPIVGRPFSRCDAP
jgi:hypothetical protein